MTNAIHQVGPRIHPGFGLRQMEPVEHDPIEAFTRKHERHLINARDILGRDDRLFIDVAEQCDLALDVLIEEAVGPAERMSGWMPMARKSRTLCCVGLVLSSPAAPMNRTSVKWT